MEKSRFKEIRLKFFNISVLVTLATLLIFLSIMMLYRRGLLTLPETVETIVMRLIVVIGTLFTISVVLRITLRRVFSLFDEPEESIFYSKIYTWLLYGTGVFIILGYFGVSLGNITLIIGLMATGLAFAVRDVLLSFFGWMVLLRKKPIRIGDYIQIGEDEGRVQHIGTFFVLLASPLARGDEFIRVPNRLFLEKSITKRGKELFTDRLNLPIKGVPENFDQKITDLNSDLTTILPEKGSIHIYINIIHDKLCLVAEFPSLIAQKEKIRSVVIMHLFSHFGNYIVVPQA
jgi:MscS family membrane protein